MILCYKSCEDLRVCLDLLGDELRVVVFNFMENCLSCLSKEHVISIYYCSCFLNVVVR